MGVVGEIVEKVMERMQGKVDIMRKKRVHVFLLFQTYPLTLCHYLVLSISTWDG
jgi:hypothetical protein